MAAVDQAVNTGTNLIKGAANQLLNPKKLPRNIMIGGAAVVLFPAFTAAAGAAAGGAPTAFVGTLTQQAVGGAHTIIENVPGTLSAAWQLTQTGVGAVGSMPWTEMWEAANSASYSAGAAAGAPIYAPVDPATASIGSGAQTGTFSGFGEAMNDAAPSTMVA